MIFPACRADTVLVRRAAAAAITIAIATAAGCRSETRVEPDVAERYIRCLAVRATRSVTCTDVSVGSKPVEDASGTAILLAAQHDDVELRAHDVRWARDDVSFAASIRNLVGQPIGTSDGRSADARGIVIRMADISADLDTASVSSAAVPPTAAEPTQIAWRVAGVLDSGEVSAPTRLTLRTTVDAPSVMFGVTITAPVQHPRGWLRVRSASVSERGTVKLHASRLDVLGRETALAPDVTWRIAGGAEYATVTPSGRLDGKLAGIVTVVAACEESCDAAPDTVNIPVTDESGVILSVDPTSRHHISPYIYGVNFLTEDGAAMKALPPWYGATVPGSVTLNRLGGNRFSAYNWRNNFSNAGADYRHQNDRYLEATAVPGEAVRRRVVAAQGRGAATVVTIPMLPWVAGDDQGVPLDTVDATRAQRLATHFVPNRPAPAPGDPAGTVYQSEFVRWLDSTMTARGDTLPIFWSLDNEPDIWHATHNEIMSDSAGKRRTQTYDGFAATSIAFASAVKSVQERAIVFGPATATYAGIATLGQTPDKDPVHGSKPFLDVYLDRFRAAEASTGRRLLDVLDVHWYPEMGTRAGGITNDWATQDSQMVAVRVNAPRSLWDGTYDEQSWVSRVTGGPIALLPRLRKTIATHYPGTALSISEYFYGRAGDISGGIAQADLLGIFGREGLFAATMWPQGAIGAYGNDGVKTYAYALGAFRLFTDYDGAGHRFGRIGLGAYSSDASRASVYASRDEAGRLVLILINRTQGALNATVPILRGSQPRTAQIWTMRDGAPIPERGANVPVAPGTALHLRLPALSASTVVLDP
jgi:Glycoside hydrolase family 44